MSPWLYAAAVVVIDPVPESVRLMERGLSADPPWLSRRRRHVALAVDVNGPLACTVFMHRYNSGQLERRVHVFTRRDGVWRSAGGEHRSAVAEDGLSDRPRAAALGSVVVEEARGAVQTNADRVFPWPRRYIGYALLRAADEVDSVTFDDRRLVVPRHGHVVAVWNSSRTPRPVAYDAHGAALGSLVLHHQRGRPGGSRTKQRWREPGQPPWWW